MNKFFSYQQILMNMQREFASHSALAIKKLSPLACISAYEKTEQKRRIMKSFISTQFGHCQLLLMFYSKRLYSFLNLIQEQAIFPVSNDKISIFEIFVTMIRVFVG